EQADRCHGRRRAGPHVEPDRRELPVPVRARRRGSRRDAPAVVLGAVDACRAEGLGRRDRRRGPRPRGAGRPPPPASMIAIYGPVRPETGLPPPPMAILGG